MIFIKDISEWRVKVVGNQSCVGLGNLRVNGSNAYGTQVSWGKKSRVAPESSDLSPYWSNMNED